MTFMVLRSFGAASMLAHLPLLGACLVPTGSALIQRSAFTRALTGSIALVLAAFALLFPETWTQCSRLLVSVVLASALMPAALRFRENRVHEKIVSDRAAMLR